jgi:hypothetical protein
MSKSAAEINPSKSLDIKLGRSGSYEKKYLESGILRFGYRETPSRSSCQTSKWRKSGSLSDRVYADLSKERKH